MREMPIESQIRAVDWKKVSFRISTHRDAFSLRNVLIRVRLGILELISKMIKFLRVQSHN